MSRDCAVFGVAYPAVAPFLDDYFNSLKSQKSRNFDLVILNDGFEGLGQRAASHGFEVREVANCGTPAENRSVGINALVAMGYKKAVFTDLDDYFSPTRVGASLALLEECDIVVNDLSLVDSAGGMLQERYLSRRLHEGMSLAEESIRELNVFGFSNTAARLGCLGAPLELPPELVAVDWYVYARALHAGARAVFTASALTYYRQHGANTIGMGPEGLERRLQSALRAKLLHYRHMSEADASYEGLYRSIDALSGKMIELDYRRDYVERVRRLSLSNPLWWEEIRTPEELGL